MLARSLLAPLGLRSATISERASSAVLSFKFSRAASASTSSTAGISRVTGTPLVPTNHPESVRVMRELSRASTPYDFLTIFEREAAEGPHTFGWATAKETIKRIAKHRSVRNGGAAAAASICNDDRFLRLLDVPATALRQGVMGSKARLNYQTDDLTSIQAALQKLRVPADNELHSLLAKKLEEEREEDDEPGEHGSDFQGGSVGF